MDNVNEITVDREDLTEAVRACALLADLTVGIWAGEATDRGLMEKIKVDAGAVGNTGRVIKNLMAGCENHLKEVRAAYQCARQVHYDLTLPWVSNPTASRIQGPRLLPNLLFTKYLTDMSELKREAIRALRKFLDVYPDLIVRAQANLGGMAKPEDYPTVDQVEARFKLSFDFAPIPAATAFQGLPEGMLERLGNQLHKRQEAAVGLAQAAMWERVKETVGHLIERLEGVNEDGTPKVFKVNSIDNVRELIVLLPGFNCAGDPRVTTVVEDIEHMLEGVNAKSLRNNQGVRSDVVNKAQAINDKLAKWGL